MHFDFPYAFLFLLLIPFLHRVWMKKNSPEKIKFSLSVPKDLKKRNPAFFLLFLRYGAFFFLVFALARPQFARKEVDRKKNGVDILLLMDVSASMNIPDLEDRTRFDVAKKTMEDFVKGRPDDRIGLVIFSGEPLTLSPLTLDHGLVLSGIQEARSGVLKDGTAIGDGLSLAVQRMKSSEAKSKVIVLLTDGDSNVGQIDPLTAGDLASGYGIKVYTIAIGKEGRVRVPVIRPGPFGQEITTYQWQENALNTEVLEKIAETTKAKFFRVTDGDALQSVFKNIDQLEKTEISTSETISYDEKFSIYLLYALFLLFFERLLSYTVWRFAR